MRFFFYGTLRDPDVAAVVLGRNLAAEWATRAILPGYRTVRLAVDPYPVLSPDRSGEAAGIVTPDLAAADVGRIVFFESVEYAPREMKIMTPAGDVLTAHVFGATERARHDGVDWRIDDWRASEKARALREAVSVRP